MKNIRFLIYFVLLSLLNAGSISAEDTLSNLNEPAHNHKDPGIFYNLGIASLNSGDLGHAVLNLKRASLLDPSDTQIKDALDALRESIGIPLYLFELTPLEKLIVFPFTLFSLNTGFLIGLVLFIAGSTVLSLYFSHTAFPFIKFNNNKIRLLSIILISAGIIYILGSLVRFSFTFDNKSAVVVSLSRLNERPVPDSIKITDAAVGMECTVKKEEDGFYLIDTIDGHEGWIERTNIELLWP